MGCSCRIRNITIGGETGAVRDHQDNTEARGQRSTQAVFMCPFRDACAMPATPRRSHSHAHSGLHRPTVARCTIPRGTTRHAHRGPQLTSAPAAASRLAMATPLRGQPPDLLSQKGTRSLPGRRGRRSGACVTTAPGTGAPTRTSPATHPSRGSPRKSRRATASTSSACVTRALLAWSSWYTPTPPSPTLSPLHPQRWVPPLTPTSQRVDNPQQHQIITWDCTTTSVPPASAVARLRPPPLPQPPRAALAPTLADPVCTHTSPLTAQAHSRTCNAPEAR